MEQSVILKAFVEAVRQLKWKLGSTRCITVHLTLIPYLASAKELKTKPTQHSVKMLLESGLQADILVCRTEYPLNRDIRRKLALFCNVNINAVIEAIDVDTIYDVPLSLLKEGLDDIVLSKLKLPKHGEPDLTSWKEFLSRLKNPTNSVRIALVGKYVELQDAYKSILKVSFMPELPMNVRWRWSASRVITSVQKTCGKN